MCNYNIVYCFDSAGPGIQTLLYLIIFVRKEMCVVLFFLSKYCCIQNYLYAFNLTYSWRHTGKIIIWLECFFLIKIYAEEGIVPFANFFFIVKRFFADSLFRGKIMSVDHRIKHIVIYFFLIHAKLLNCNYNIFFQQLTFMVV